MRRFAPRPTQRDVLAARVGQQLKRFRTERGWSIAEVATALEMPMQWMEDYEAGFRLPRTYTLQRLADLFGVSVASLLDVEPPVEPVVDDRLLAALRRVQQLELDDRRAIADLLTTLAMGIERLRRGERRRRRS